MQSPPAETQSPPIENVLATVLAYSRRCASFVFTLMEMGCIATKMKTTNFCNAFRLHLRQLICVLVTSGLRNIHMSCFFSQHAIAISLKEFMKMSKC